MVGDLAVHCFGVDETPALVEQACQPEVLEDWDVSALRQDRGQRLLHDADGVEIGTLVNDVRDEVFPS